MIFFTLGPIITGSIACIIGYFLAGIYYGRKIKKLKSKNEKMRAQAEALDGLQKWRRQQAEVERMNKGINEDSQENKK